MERSRTISTRIRSFGHTIAKRYRLAQRLGGSPLGAAYLAVELATGRKVTVKILPRDLVCADEVLKHCLWDGRFAAASQPSRIARVYEVDRTDGDQVFIASEYLEGESLADLLRREGPLELGRALRLAGEVAQGLAAASRAGVAYRNIKPENIMVTGLDERVRVTDFGVAWLRRPGRGGSGTREASRFAAPEQLLGGDADDLTDIYGVGAVLYAKLAGTAPPVTGAPAPARRDDRWVAPPPSEAARQLSRTRSRSYGSPVSFLSGSPAAAIE